MKVTMSLSYLTRLIHLLFVSGIATASFTKVRLPGLSIGMSELLLALSAGFAALKLLHTLRVRENDSTYFAVFWLVSFLLLTAGFFTNFTLVYPIDVSGAIHDGIAFVFCFIILLLFWFIEIDSSSTLLSLLRKIYVTSAWLFAIMLAFLATDIDVPIYSLYDEYHFRFTGLSINPNQLALYLLPLPFLCEYLVKVENRKRYYWGLLTILPIGFLTLSDSLYLAWTILGSVYYIFFKRYVSNKNLDLSLKFLLFLFISFLGAIVFALLGDYYETISAGSSQGSERINRWHYAIQAISISPLWGFGPGSFSGTSGIWQQQEAHNTLLDWALSTGLLGVSVLLWYWTVIFWRLFTNREWILLASFLGILFFAMFHYVLRQPIYWFYSLCYLGLVNNRETKYIEFIK